MSFHVFYKKIKNSFLMNKGLRNVKYGVVTFSHCTIINHGKNNRIFVGDSSTLFQCKIDIEGNDNEIKIGACSGFDHATIGITGNGNQILIGDHCSSNPRLFLGVTGGTKLLVGSDCMFASDVFVLTTDAHPIFKQNNLNVAINPPRDVTVGEHVWVGHGATLLKGADIGKNSIIGASSVVTSGKYPEGSILAGNPSKIVKTDVTWKRPLV
jgi:acetyltransferase-like isoleucine patch superfamily enzyme